MSSIITKRSDIWVKNNPIFRGAQIYVPDYVRPSVSGIVTESSNRYGKSSYFANGSSASIGKNITAFNGSMTFFGISKPTRTSWTTSGYGKDWLLTLGDGAKYVYVGWSEHTSSTYRGLYVLFDNGPYTKEICIGVVPANEYYSWIATSRNDGANNTVWHLKMCNLHTKTISSITTTSNNQFFLEFNASNVGIGQPTSPIHVQQTGIIGRSVTDQEATDYVINPFLIKRNRKHLVYSSSPSFPVLTSLGVSAITSIGGRLTASA
jgi:hypothetical protein